MIHKNKAKIIQNKIYSIRGTKVMLDFDLAELYGIETKFLKRAVRRNPKRFPKDFKFELKVNEWESLKRKFGSSKWGGIRYRPYAFTEFGIAMLSSVLNSELAIEINIEIIRVFSKIKTLLLNQKDLLLRIERVESRLGKHDEDITILFLNLKQLLSPKIQPRKRIGFRRKDELD